MRILLAKRRALGDTVFLSGTISALAQVEASLEIHVLVPRAFASLLEGHPHIRSIFQYDTGRFRLLRDVRALRFDHFVQLHSSPSQHWLARLSGARQVHFSVQNNETEKAYGKHPSALEWDGFFLRRIFGERLSVPVPEPKIYLSEQEREEGVRIWRSLGVDPGRVVFLGLGASRPTKRWPTQHFARLEIGRAHV